MAGSILLLTKSTMMCLSQSYETFFFITDAAAKKLDRLSLTTFLSGQPNDFEFSWNPTQSECKPYSQTID
jgi:hypothetical protein